MPSPLQDHVWHGALDGMVERNRLRPLREHHEHRHTELEFNLVVAGHGAYRTPQRRYDLGPGSAAWLFPGTDHRLVRTSPDFTLWVMAISASALRRHLASKPYHPLHGAAPPGRWVRSLDRCDRDLLVAVFTDLAQAQAAQDHVRFNHGLRYAVACAWGAFVRAADRPEGHPAVAGALEHLRGDPAMETARIAELAGVGQRRLAALIRAELGTGLVGLRNRCRVECALRRARSAHDLARAAAEAGFASYRQFHRACVQVAGAPPREAWRAARGQIAGG